MSITTDDIAALVVVANPNAPFQSKLNRRHIDIEWILWRDADGDSPPRFRQANNPISASMTSLGRPRSVQRDEPHRSDDAGDEDGGHKALTPAPQSIAGSSVAGSESRRRRRSPLDEGVCAPSPERVRARHERNMANPKTLRDIDFTGMSPETVEEGQILLSSPRSVLVVLKNGLGVEDLLAPPQRAIRNQALLDGVSQDAVRLRLKSEADRREVRRQMMLAEYDKLASAVDREDVVNAMRDHFFSEFRQDKANVSSVRRMKPLVPAGKLDLSLLDEECVAIVEKARAAGANEIRRTIEQVQRQKARTLEKERSLLETEKALAGNAKASNVHRDKILAEKKAAAAAKREAVHRRVQTLLDNLHAEEESRRREIPRWQVIF